MKIQEHIKAQQWITYHMDPMPTNHPPSLKNPRKIPVDDPREKDNRFLDVTKRNSKANHDFRLKLLKQKVGNHQMVNTTPSSQNSY